MSRNSILKTEGYIRKFPDIHFLNINEEDFLGKEYLYKHMSLNYVLKNLEDKTLLFSNPETWKDPYEKRFIKASYIKRDGTEIVFPWKGRVYCSCFTQDVVSEAHWQIHSSSAIPMEFYRYKENLEYNENVSEELEIFKTIYKMESDAGIEKVELIFGVILKLNKNGKIDPLYIKTGFEAINIKAKIHLQGEEYNFIFSEKINKLLNPDNFEKLENLPILYAYNRNRISFLIDDIKNPGKGSKSLGRHLNPDERAHIIELLSKEYQEDASLAAVS